MLAGPRSHALGFIPAHIPSTPATNTTHASILPAASCQTLTLTERSQAASRREHAQSAEREPLAPRLCGDSKVLVLKSVDNFSYFFFSARCVDLENETMRSEFSGRLRRLGPASGPETDRIIAGPSGFNGRPRSVFR